MTIVSDLLAAITPKLIQDLHQADQEEAARVKSARCPLCGGTLHVANYPRKPRGVGADEPKMHQRQSFCCSKCRKRNTPKSVRFLGRKVYSAVNLVVAELLRKGGVSSAKTCGFIGMCFDTLRRWSRWWGEPVQSSRWWKCNRALVVPPIEGKNLIGGLFSRLFAHVNCIEIALHKLLTFISHLTVPAEYRSLSAGQGNNPQKMRAVFS